MGIHNDPLRMERLQHPTPAAQPSVHEGPNVENPPAELATPTRSGQKTFLSHLKWNFTAGVLAFPKAFFTAIPPDKMSVKDVAGTVGLVLATPVVMGTWLLLSPLMALTALVDSTVKATTGKDIVDHDKTSKLEKIRAYRQSAQNQSLGIDERDYTAQKSKKRVGFTEDSPGNIKDATGIRP